MIDPQPANRSDLEQQAKRRGWSVVLKCVQPVAIALCAMLLVSDRGTDSEFHAAAPQVNSSQIDGRGIRTQQKKDDEGWTDVQQWMQNNCINQWTFYNTKLADRPGQQQRARRLMIEQYQRISGTKDPKMREVLTMQATYRDNIFGIVLRFRRHEVNRVIAQRQIEGWAEKLAEIEIFTRRARINELSNEIAELQQHRNEYVARVSAHELNQADLPPGRMGASGVEAAPLDDPISPPSKSKSTTRPSSR